MVYPVEGLIKLGDRGLDQPATKLIDWLKREKILVDEKSIEGKAFWRYKENIEGRKILRTSYANCTCKDDAVVAIL